MAAAQAAQIGFGGLYDPLNWDTYNEAGGAVNTSQAPDRVLIRGGNSGVYPVEVPGFTRWFITSPGTGQVSFNWSYSTSDVAGPVFDPAGYVLNGAIFQLTGNDGGLSQSGSLSFNVNAGEAFGFYVHTYDGLWGPGELTVSNFAGPDEAAVPEPATLLLVGGGAVFCVLRRRATKSRRAPAAATSVPPGC
jgi:hypothetical protein